MIIIVMDMSKTTILVESATREELRQMGRKNQTYDQLIMELIKSKRTSSQDPLDRRLANLQPIESVNS
jgi:hypothetical protein